MVKPKKIAVITGTRADFGLYYPILKLLKADKQFKLSIIATSMHLSPKYGNTYKEILSKGFKIAEKVRILKESDDLGTQAKELGNAIIKLTEALERIRPDYIMVLGDRGEMLAAGIAAIHLNIKIIHLHGGEVTGTVDNPVRHMISQIAHIHFISCRSAANRLKSMGISRNVFLVGAPGLDYIKEKLFQKEKVQKYLGLEPGEEYILFIQHPETEKFQDTQKNINSAIEALGKIPFKKIVLLPNSDAGREVIKKRINKIKDSNKYKVFTNFEHNLYLSILKYSKCLIGNSSSGIIESTIFQIPVINIGERQKGREHAGNVIDTGYSSKEIISAWNRINTKAFSELLKKMKSPYYFGGASKNIVKKLQELK
ncbi:MAG: UDP-N-acetylglucosamine 2-epimerase [bacterium]|nr:UDP-N-acetylglucosamine 2-epimerase [bacterium]